MIGVAWLIAGLLACSGGDGAPAPKADGAEQKPVPVAEPRPEPRPEIVPAVAPVPPSSEGETRTPIPLTEGLKATRDTLAKVVRDHGRDPANPWAIGHAMLALGSDVTLSNDADAVDWLFSEYAEVATVAGTDLVTFPTKRGEVRIEPHTDLVLKAITERGVAPTRVVTVEDREFPLSDLYRHSMWRAWARGTRTGFQAGEYNDAPWALQGLAAWAPDDEPVTWVAEGGRDMTLDALTTATVDVLEKETRFMAEAMHRGEVIPKDTRRGLFGYTCGGQHLLQGASYAVGAGFGTDEDRARICEQREILDWRIDVELQAVDAHLSNPATPPPLLKMLTIQRLKFLGHYLETTHKLSALGLCEIDAKHSERVAVELQRTVGALEQLGVLADPVATLRNDEALDGVGPGRAEQTWLDLIGDSAHAVRGIDLATGEASLRY